MILVDWEQLLNIKINNIRRTADIEFLYVPYNLTPILYEICQKSIDDLHITTSLDINGIKKFNKMLKTIFVNALYDSYKDVQDVAHLIQVLEFQHAIKDPHDS